MNITLFGSGYVGLVTGACLAEVGNDVLCVDIDEAKIENLQQGKIPIYEPGLETLINKNSEAGRLGFTTDIDRGVAHGLFQFVAVGTPPDADGSADLQYVHTVAHSIAERMEDYRIIVNKSTVPVGTADQVKSIVTKILMDRGRSLEFDIVSNPEFLKEGAAIEDFMRPERIVVGTDNPRTKALLHALYAPFNRNRDRVVAMDVRSAELTKYAANAMLATKISFMNEMANLAERVGADIEQVRKGIGSDSRIGYHFIYPGCGYGGSCFPKDVRALLQTARESGQQAPILVAVEETNQRQKQVLFQKISHYFKGELADRTFALWGLSFKPNTDDMREAPSRYLIESLRACGASVRAYDPVAMEEAQKLYGEDPKILLCDQPHATLIGADALVIVTEWNIFRSPDFLQIKQTLLTPLIFDGRNLYDPALLQSLGFEYYAIGRGTKALLTDSTNGVRV